MVGGSTFRVMELDMKEVGKMINLMDLVFNCGLIQLSMKEIILMGKEMDLVNNIGVME